MAPDILVCCFATFSQEEARYKTRLFLQQALAHWGLDGRFATLRTSATGRPGLAPSPSLPFPPDISCSHAPGRSALALGRGCRVGIDVEPLSTAFPPPMFARLFSPAELAHPLADPVHLWTRKEAVLKADGRGLSLEPALLDVLEDKVLFGDVLWHLHRINAGEQEYACHLATNVAAVVPQHLSLTLR